METVKFYPGLNGEVKVMIEAEGFRYPHQYKMPGSKKKFDYGLIKLKERVPDFKKENQLVLGVNFEDLTACLCIFGYPGLGNYKYNKNQHIVQGYQRGL